MWKRILIGASLVLTCPLVHAEEYVGKITRPGPQIEGLELKTEELEHIKVPTAEPGYIFLNASLSGKLQQGSFVWVNPDSKIPISNGGFSIPVLLNRKQTEFTLVVADERKKEIAQERILVEFHLVVPAEPRVRGSIGLGLSSVSFSQNILRGTVNEIGVVVRTNFSWKFLPPKWDTEVSGFFTLLPLNSADVTLDDGRLLNERPRFYGANWGVGYEFITRADLSIAVHVGPYIWGMLGTPFYGIPIAGGLQIYPSAVYRLSDSQSIRGFFRYSMIAKQFALFSPSNHERGLGLSYVARRWAYSIELSQLDFNDTVDDVSTQIQMIAVTGGVSFLF